MSAYERVQVVVFEALQDRGTSLIKQPPLKATRFIEISSLRGGCELVLYVSFDLPRWRVVVVFAN